MSRNHQLKSVRRSGRPPDQKSSAPREAMSPSTPIHPLLQLQKAIGNRAVLQLLAAQRMSKQQPPIQMRKISKQVAYTYSELLLDIMDEIMESEGEETDLHSDLYTFYNALDDQMDEKDFSLWVREILNYYPLANYPVLAQLSGVGSLTHPSGIADGRGVLAANITKIRQHMYPSGYIVAAKQIKTDTLNHRAVSYGTSWNCPSCGNNRSWDDITIDHIMPVAEHWNRYGHDQTKQDRHDWFNDTDNHQCMCRSCNSSFGSGGIYYSRVVGPNFRN